VTRLRSARSALSAEAEQHAVAGNPTGLIPSLASWTRGTVRIGVTGLARAGKTAFLTSLAANLMAMGTGQRTLPALAARLGGRRLDVALAAAGASAVPRFNYGAHLGDRTRKCSLRPVRANGPGTYAASNDGRFRSGLSRPGPGWASAAQT
jgi:putative protein kinase ArgK-like GTPase of G3E family